MLATGNASRVETSEDRSGDVSGLLQLLASPGESIGDLQVALGDLPKSQVAALIHRIEYHRIDGLAHRAISRLPADTVDPWLRSVLRRRHQRFAAATLSQGLALAEVLDRFYAASVPVVVMRGMRSVEAIYRDPGARPFEDHDLMVLPRHSGVAHDVLDRLGFRRQARALFRRGGMIVDLHTDPLGAARRPSRGAAFPFSCELLLARAARGTVAGAPALVLSLEDELLLLAIHLVKHSFDRLIRVADLAHLIAAHAVTVEWEAVRRRAEASRSVRLLRWALEAAARVGAPVPAEFTGPAEVGTFASFLMRRVVELRPFPYTGEVLMALGSPSPAHAVRFLLDAFFPADEMPAGIVGRTAAVPRRTVALMSQAVRQVSLKRSAR